MRRRIKMDKKDIIIADLKKNYEATIENLNKDQKELMEDIQELELVRDTLSERVEILNKKLQEKDALIGQLKTNDPDIEREKRYLPKFLDDIMLAILNEEDSTEIVKFIITEKKGVL
jgi:peptidoglycan hydrolase CwlO-like protein